MKKLLIIIMLLIPVLLFSQSPLSKGVYTVGGSISLSAISEEDDDDTIIIFALSPNVGYFFIDNIYTSLLLSYSYYSSGSNSSNLYGFGPMVRYYFNGEKLHPYLGASYLYNYYKYDNSSKNSSSDYTLMIGADYFVTKYFAFEASADYTFRNNHSESGSFSNDRKSKLFNLSIGARYFIY